MEIIGLPVSKSLIIRKLVYNFLYDDCIESIPSDAPEDIRIMHHCLTLVSKAPKCDNETTEPQQIDVRDCGAAYRFLMAVLAVTPGQWLLTGTPRLLQRPIEELVQALRSIGADIQWCSCRDVINRIFSGGDVYPCRDTRTRVSASENSACWLIHGKPLHISELTIDCTRSGQFASALLMISKKIGLQKLHILPENPASSTYIAMTESIMEGKTNLDANHMGDWSAAVYWYARLLLEGRMHRLQRTSHSAENASFDKPVSYKLSHLDLRSIQSDAALAHWFSQWGVNSRQEEDGVVIEFVENVDIQNDIAKSDESRIVREENNQEDVIELDMDQNLDLVPVLACMACLWPKKMVFNGVANLKYKESNRLQIIREQLSPFAIIEIKFYNGIADNQLVISPIETHSSYSNSSSFFSFKAHNDHRFVMGFSLFAIKGKVQIKGFDCVRKSYPNFNAEGVIAGSDIVG